jgi:hypothetical protein
METPAQQPARLFRTRLAPTALFPAQNLITIGPR